jgi:hypothetical protein
MNYLKIIQRASIFFMAFISTPICPAATETRITEIENIYVKHGDKTSISAGGQLNEGSRWVDIDGKYLTFTVSDINGTKIISKTEKINFWDGKASVDIDTYNLIPGRYIIDVKYMGNKYLCPCKAHASLVVISPHINFQNQNPRCNL